MIAVMLMISVVFGMQTQGCNLPPGVLLPAPDGCVGEFPVARPVEPIPPACISGTEVYRWIEAGQPVVELTVWVDHPELCEPGQCVGELRLARYGAGDWELSAIDAGESCAKDEAPLAWATMEALNRWSAGWDVYTGSLPEGYLELMEMLGVYRMFFPFAVK
ncbi:MAG: hypothetical protein U9R25_12330 [Chloroflexota bacterium]|nr:hypothetical protein [Chloroflexota bacterium]